MPDPRVPDSFTNWTYVGSTYSHFNVKAYQILMLPSPSPCPSNCHQIALCQSSFHINTKLAKLAKLSILASKVFTSANTYSSRMRTARLLTVSRGGGGGVKSASGGVCIRGVFIQRGMHPGGYASRGSLNLGGGGVGWTDPPPPVDRQTPVKHYLAPNFICGPEESYLQCVSS